MLFRWHMTHGGSSAEFERCFSHGDERTQELYVRSGVERVILTPFPMWVANWYYECNRYCAQVENDGALCRSNAPDSCSFVRSSIANFRRRSFVIGGKTSFDYMLVLLEDSHTREITSRSIKCYIIVYPSALLCCRCNRHHQPGPTALLCTWNAPCKEILPSNNTLQLAPRALCITKYVGSILPQLIIYYSFLYVAFYVCTFWCAARSGKNGRDTWRSRLETDSDHISLFVHSPMNYIFLVSIAHIHSNESQKMK